MGHKIDYRELSRLSARPDVPVIAISVAAQTEFCWRAGVLEFEENRAQDTEDLLIGSGGRRSTAYDPSAVRSLAAHWGRYSLWWLAITALVSALLGMNWGGDIKDHFVLIGLMISAVGLVVTGSQYLWWRLLLVYIG